MLPWYLIWWLCFFSSSLPVGRTFWNCFRGDFHSFGPKFVFAFLRGLSHFFFFFFSPYWYVAVKLQWLNGVILCLLLKVGGCAALIVEPDCRSSCAVTGRDDLWVKECAGAGWFSGSHFLSGLGLLQGMGSNIRDSFSGWAGSIIAIFPCRSDLIAFGVAIVLISQPRLPATGWSNKTWLSALFSGWESFESGPILYSLCAVPTAREQCPQVD